MFFILITPSSQKLRGLRYLHVKNIKADLKYRYDPIFLIFYENNRHSMQITDYVRKDPHRNSLKECEKTYFT